MLMGEIQFSGRKTLNRLAAGTPEDETDCSGEVEAFSFAPLEGKLCDDLAPTEEVRALAFTGARTPPMRPKNMSASSANPSLVFMITTSPI
jgi:hypothetical protein